MPRLKDLLANARAENAGLLPIRMRLPCEACGELHVDEGDFAAKPHHTHQCAKCGLVWRPEPGHPCVYCHELEETCRLHDEAIDNEDPRKVGLKRGLAQLDLLQLDRLIEWVEAGRPVLLDRDDLARANYSDSTGEPTYCPLAIALHVPAIGFHDDEEIADWLQGWGYSIYNTRGISGAFYTTNRREDLLTAAREVRAEKEARMQP